MDVAAHRYDAGIPPGTARLALELAEHAAGSAEQLTGCRYVVDPITVLAHLLLPFVVGEVPVTPPARPVAGGGWVHADVLDEDEALFELLAADAAGPEALAAAAQECRLPVTPYRGRVARWSPPAAPPRGAGRSVPDAVAVVDLTTMWAGPLATMLLGAWGARVTTVEPPARPDGLRGSPAQFAILDTTKQRRPWDLRDTGARQEFEEAVRDADVLVESFSARVMANLGYDHGALRRLNPGLTTVSVRAFASWTPERSWIAYGRGVHAASGLGVIADVPSPALLAYPDPLAGLMAFGAVLDALGAGGGRHVEISLAAAMAPLLTTAGSPLGVVDDVAIAELRGAVGRGPGPIISTA